MDTKIALSDKELELVCNTEWILTKHTVTRKVYDLFGTLAPAMEEILSRNKTPLPQQVTALPPKISRGENYRLLPYVMLDYPRHFGKEDTVAIRTFFWWGHFFSVNLQLSGIYKNNFAEQLPGQYNYLQRQGFSLCVHNEPWEHHFEADNFISLNDMSLAGFNDQVNNKPFVKMAKNIPVERWNEAPGFIMAAFSELAAVLEKIRHPGGEKDL